MMLMLRFTVATTAALVLLLQAPGSDAVGVSVGVGVGVSVVEDEDEDEVEDVTLMSLEHQRALEGGVGIGIGIAVGHSIVEDEDVTLVSFEPNSNKHTWTTVNDPVMGGGSTSTVTVNGGLGIWEGDVKIVEKLGAPGFCTLRTAGDEGPFPDPTETEYFGLRLAESSGLPLEDFSVQIAIRDATIRQLGDSDISDDYSHLPQFRAMLGDEYCCGNFCQVPWTAFKLSRMGESINDGPELVGNLDKISRIGLGTSGTEGEFSLSIKSFFATNSKPPTCTEEAQMW